MIEQLNVYETTCDSVKKKESLLKNFDREDFTSNPVIKEIHYNCNCSKKILRKVLKKIT